MKRAIQKHVWDFTAIVVLAVIAFAVGGYILSNQRFYAPSWVPVVGSDFVDYQAQFQTAQAFTAGQGQTVMIAGVNVGEIGKVTLKEGRALITMKIKRKYTPIYKDATALSRPKTGLNDMVIERGPTSQLINVAMTVDRLPITHIKADGLIVATPTGSTAYNLAGGGPILHPEVDALVVTPICPHSLTSRPFIFPDKRKVQFSILGAGKKAVLTMDGVKRAKIGPNDEVWVDRHAHDHLFLRKVGHNFFSLLKEKLKFGERA